MLGRQARACLPIMIVGGAVILVATLGGPTEASRSIDPVRRHESAPASGHGDRGQRPEPPNGTDAALAEAPPDTAITPNEQGRTRTSVPPHDTAPSTPTGSTESVITEWLNVGYMTIFDMDPC